MSILIFTFSSKFVQAFENINIYTRYGSTSFFLPLDLRELDPNRMRDHDR